MDLALDIINMMVDDDNDGGAVEDDARPRRRVKNEIYTCRRKLWTMMDEVAFKASVGITLGQFELICQLVAPVMLPRDPRGGPIPIKSKVMAAINVLRGNEFLLKAGEITGISKNGSWFSIEEFVEAINLHKAEYIRMPTRRECARTATAMYEKFGLKSCALGIDGCLMKMKEKPRFKVPPGEGEAQGQDYWCWKGSFGLNAMIVSDDNLIRDVLAHPPGGRNDPMIYNASEFKAVWHEQYRPFVCLGDSAYALSEALITPFSYLTKDYVEQKFNRRHSGTRCLMTECIFGRLKRMYPVLNELRYYVEKSQKVVLACCILYNLRVMDGEEPEPEDLWTDTELEEFHNLDDRGHWDEVEVDVNFRGRTPSQIRTAGAVVRLKMMREMRFVK